MKSRQLFLQKSSSGILGRVLDTPLGFFHIPTVIYIFKVINRNARCEICSKLTIKTPGVEQVNAGWVDFLRILQNFQNSHYFSQLLQPTRKTLNKVNNRNTRKKCEIC